MTPAYPCYTMWHVAIISRSWNSWRLHIEVYMQLHPIGLSIEQLCLGLRFDLTIGHLIQFFCKCEVFSKDSSSTQKPRSGKSSIRKESFALKAFKQKYWEAGCDTPDVIQLNLLTTTFKCQDNYIVITNKCYIERNCAKHCTRKKQRGESSKHFN